MYIVLLATMDVRSALGVSITRILGKYWKSWLRYTLAGPCHGFNWVRPGNSWSRGYLLTLGHAGRGVQHSVLAMVSQHCERKANGSPQIRKFPQVKMIECE